MNKNARSILLRFLFSSLVWIPLFAGSAPARAESPNASSKKSSSLKAVKPTASTHAPGHVQKPAASTNPAPLQAKSLKPAVVVAKSTPIPSAPPLVVAAPALAAGPSTGSVIVGPLKVISVKSAPVQSSATDLAAANSAFVRQLKEATSEDLSSLANPNIDWQKLLPPPTSPTAAKPVAPQPEVAPLETTPQVSKAKELPATSIATEKQPLSPNSRSNMLSSEELVQELKKRDFVCHASGVNKNVQRCLGNIKDYPQKVLFFVPNHLDTTKVLNLVYHFHGYNIYAGQGPLETHFNENDGSGDFASWIDKGHLNGIVIAPLSQGHCTTFFSYFSDHAGTRSFFDETQNIIMDNVSKAFTDMRISLSSHSGSDTTLSYLSGTLPQSQLNLLHSMGLFDSMYGYHKGLVDAIVEHHVKVFDSYLARGTTAKYQPWFIDHLEDSHLDPTVVKVTEATHMTLMSKDQFSNFLATLP